MTSYDGQRALVTGAASGIGRALAIALSEAGSHVIATDRDADALAALASDYPTISTGVHDVSSREDWSTVVTEHGPIDILVNNAGIGMAGEVRDTPLSDWERVIAVNTMGTILGIDAVYSGMVERGRGRIINVASGAGLLPRPGMVPYATSKAAVLGLSRSFQPEAAQHGVHVHVVCPGYIATSIMKKTTWRGVDGDALQAAIPLKPMTADRCAHVVLRSAKRGRVVIPVTAATWIEWWLERVSPNLTLKIARIRAKTFSRHRAPP